MKIHSKILIWGGLDDKMPEVSKNAAILIATSFQALNRAKAGDATTMLCNCTITVLFAGFFIEENLDEIVKKMHVMHEMKNFLGKEYPSLYHKLAWYFNQYVTEPKSDNPKGLEKLERRINKKFPGFRRIYEIRNFVAHGKIQRRLTLREAEKLRQQAKVIVDDLFVIAKKHNYEIPRKITYEMAITDPNIKLSED